MIPFSTLPRKSKKALKSAIKRDLISDGLSQSDAETVLKNIYDIEVAKSRNPPKLMTSYKNMFIMQWKQPLFITALIRDRLGYI